MLSDSWKYSSACRYLSWILSCVLCETFWNFINTVMWLDCYDCICIWNQSKNVFYYSQLPFDLSCCSKIFINKNDGKSDTKKYSASCLLSFFVYVCNLTDKRYKYRLDFFINFWAIRAPFKTCLHTCTHSISISELLFCR